jgi:hypothetical protein
VVLKAMDRTGVDAFLDVHGDEELLFNFLAGAEGCLNWGSTPSNICRGAFLASYTRANADMQQHPLDRGVLHTCSNQI